MFQVSERLRHRRSLTDLVIPGTDPGGSALVPALVWAAILLWLVAGLLMATVPLSGDEVYYARAARAIGAFLRNEISLDSLLSTVVDYGWFVPGMSLVLTPLYVFGTPDVAVVRIYLMLVIVCLWLWAIREVAAEFGRRYAVLMLIMPGLDITWHLFSFTAWGDTGAGLFVIVAFVRTFRIARLAYAGERVLIRDVAVMEFAFAAAFYMRGSLILLAFAAHVFLFAMLAFAGHWKSFLLRSQPVIAGFLFLCVAIAPWSFAASRTLGEFVIATSTPALSFGITFGNPQDMCFGPCPGVQAGEIIWVAAVKFSRAYSAAHGMSELEAQRRMSSYATRDLTAAVYLRRVRKNFARFTMSPAQLTYERFLPASRWGSTSSTIRLMGQIAIVWTGALYFPGIVALLISNIAIIRNNKERQIFSLVLKMFTLCLFIQPFLHPSHGRYWPVFAPLMAVSAAFLVRLSADRSAPLDGGAWSLLAIQYAYVLFFFSVSLAVLVS